MEMFQPALFYGLCLEKKAIIIGISTVIIKNNRVLFQVI